MTAHNLARQLKTHGIGPEVTRFGRKTLRGYRRCDFEESWNRYCSSPSAPSQSTVTPSQPAPPLDETENMNHNTTVTNDGLQQDASGPREQQSVTVLRPVTANSEWGADQEVRIDVGA